MLSSSVQDKYWNNLVLGLVGCTIDAGDNICGARVVDKSQLGRPHTMFRIELWLKTKDTQIAKQMKDAMMEVMTDGDSNKTAELSSDFSWKAH